MTMLQLYCFRFFIVCLISICFALFNHENIWQATTRIIAVAIITLPLFLLTDFFVRKVLRNKNKKLKQ